MFNFKIFIIMEREKFSEIAAIDTTTNHRIYYARAASTSGDEVKIYRYAFERMNQEYRIRMLSLTNPIEQAIAKYEWGEFIIEQLPNYSDDRSDLFNGAKLLIIRAYSIISEERYNAKHALRKAVKALEEFDKKASSAEPASAVTSARPRKTIETRRAELKGDIARCRKLYAEVVRRCPDHKFEHIKRRAEYFDSIW